MVMHFLLNKRALNSIISFLIFISIISVVSGQDYLALQGSAAGSGRGMSGSGTQGNITVEIWSAATGGSLLYNSTSDFWSALNNSRYDILLGNGSQPLSLNFSNTYYMEIYINERELDFNTSERQVFQSPVGNITVTTPVKTTNSLNVNDFFNVTPTTSAVQTNGTITILNTDVDDALNISGAVFSDSQFKTDGSIISTAASTALGLDVGGFATVANFFNVTPATSAVRTNGTITIESVSVPAFTVNGGFNISGAGGVMSTNSTIAIITRRPNALTINGGFNLTSAGGTLITNGTINIKNPSLVTAFTVNDGFNISGTNEEVRTNGTVTIVNTDVDDALNVTGAIYSDEQFKTDGAYISTAASTALGLDVSGFAQFANFFNITPATSAVRTNGTVTITNTKTDDALNITGGLKMGSQIGSAFTFASFTISDQGIVTTDANIGPVAGRGHIIINSLTEPALRINSGFNVSGTTGELKTNGTITLVTTSSNVPTQDDALNISGGGASFGDGTDFMRFTVDPNLPLFTLKHILNVSAAGDFKIGAGSSGKLTVVSTDSDDAFNVSSGAAFFGGSVNISGQVAITNSDADDTLNLTKGGMTVLGAVVKVGDGGSTTQHHIDVYDGGANKCSYLTLYDENGGPHYFWTNTTGALLTSNLAPIGCDGEGTSVGSQA